MSTGNTSGKGLMIFALATLIGFAGSSYFTERRSDNAAEQAAGAQIAGKPQADAGKASPEASSPPGTASPLPSKTGAMAAFVRKPEPKALPDITFKDGAGADLTLASFKGRVVLLNLWATWCAPCREEMPALARLQQALGGPDFEVVALSLDRQGAMASQKFLTEAKADALKLYVDATGKQGGPLGLVGMPTTLLIDRQGREVGRLTGPAEWDSDDAKALIKSVMAQAPG